MEMRNSGQGRKDDPCYKAVKDVNELYSSVLWKVELVSNYVLKRIPKVWLDNHGSYQPSWLKCGRLDLNRTRVERK